MAAGALWLIPVVAVAFLARSVAVRALRKRRPATADAVDRWWAWTPVVVVLCLYVFLAITLIVAAPLLGMAVTVFGAVVVYFLFFGSSSTGSPFRPRRR